MKETLPVESCQHCGNELGNADPKPFCCGGCRVAYQVLNASGLGAFHTLRQGVAPLRPEPLSANDTWVDGPAFRQAHVRDQGDGTCAIRWQISGIHCAACVWLLERLPKIESGIRSARLDLGSDAIEIIASADYLPSRQRAVVASLGYRLRPSGNRHDAGESRREWRQQMLRLAVATASALGSMHVALNVLAGDWTGDLDPAARHFYGWMAIVIALPGLTYGAWAYWVGLLASIRVRRVTIDAVTAVVIAIALVAGVIGTLSGTGDLYVDAAAMFVALLSGSRLALMSVRERIRRKRSSGISVFGESARCESVDGTWKVIAVEELIAGDVVQVDRGEIIPADGEAISGDAQISVAVLTGESRAVRLDPGSQVWAGSLCVDGQVRMRCTAVGDGTRIGGLLRDARLSQPKHRDSTTDRVLRWFVPAIIVYALITAGYWLWRDPSRVLDQIVAVVLVSCPCAIGIAAPLAGAIVLGRAVQRGILIRDPDVFAAAANCSAIVLDKTGTLTTGTPACVEWDATGDPASLARVVALAARSSHPLSMGLVTEAQRQHVEACAIPSEVESVPGQGIRATINGHLIAIGSPRFTGIAMPASAYSVVIATSDGERVLSAKFSDPLQAESKSVVKALVAQGYQLGIASGDLPEVVADIAQAVGIPLDCAKGGLDPEAKARMIEDVRGRYNSVAMVGDGVNDAAALTAADLGIGLRGGLSACLELCDVVVPNGDIAAIRDIFQAARDLRRTIRLCLIFSLVYNIIGLSAVLYGAIGPLTCAIAMPASSLTVLLIALRTRAFTRPAP